MGVVNNMMGMVRMGQAPPPADPAMMGPPPGPMGPDPMAGAMPDENAILGMLLDQIMGRWQGQEVQVSGEKDVLIQTLMMLAQAGGPAMPQDMVEPGLGAPMGGDEFVEN